MRCLESQELECGRWCQHWRGHRYCVAKEVADIGAWERAWSFAEVARETWFRFKQVLRIILICWSFFVEIPQGFPSFLDIHR